MKLAASGSSDDGRLDYKRREEIRVYRKDYRYIYIYIYAEGSLLGEAPAKGKGKLPAGHRVDLYTSALTDTSITR